VHRPIETIVHVSQNQVEIRLLRPHVKGGVKPGHWDGVKVGQ
jgi:hypothetical protein